MKLVQKRKGSVRISDSGCSLLYMNIWKLKRSPPPHFPSFVGWDKLGKNGGMYRKNMDAPVYSLSKKEW